MTERKANSVVKEAKVKDIFSYDIIERTNETLGKHDQRLSCQTVDGFKRK